MRSDENGLNKRIRQTGMRFLPERTASHRRRNVLSLFPPPPNSNKRNVSFRLVWTRSNRTLVVKKRGKVWYGNTMKNKEVEWDSILILTAQIGALKLFHRAEQPSVSLALFYFMPTSSLLHSPYEHTCILLKASWATAVKLLSSAAHKGPHESPS